MRIKLAFCSCSKLQSVAKQPVWSNIRAERPDVLVLLGDNVYLESNRHIDAQALAAELRGQYERQLAEPHFAGLIGEMRAAGKRLLAIYDDHDFLGNNRYGGDHDPTLREAAREALIAAFAPPRTGADVYSATQLDELLLLVLDARFYRTAPSVSRRDRNAMLGAAQWAWLEQQVTAATGKFIVIASSTPFHDLGGENWEQYPAAFERLRALIAGRPGAMVLSGDIHRNRLHEDGGVLELVSSAVSRRAFFLAPRRENYALLDFDDRGVDVELRGRKQRDQMKFRIPLSSWNFTH